MKSSFLLYPLVLSGFGRSSSSKKDGAPPARTNALISILPALAFSLDMFAKTGESFGVNEVLLASVLGSVVFAVFAAQPLTIVGVTGTTKTPTYPCIPHRHRRSDHRLQLHRVRHHGAPRHQLLRLHVLDRPVCFPSPPSFASPNPSRTDGPSSCTGPSPSPTRATP